MYKPSRQEFSHNGVNYKNSNNLIIIISRHVKYPGIVRTFYSRILKCKLSACTNVPYSEPWLIKNPRNVQKPVERGK